MQDFPTDTCNSYLSLRLCFPELTNTLQLNLYNMLVTSAAIVTL